MNVDDTNALDETTRALSAGVRRRRQELGMTQRQLAAEMVAAGCRSWTSTTVANTERADKPRALSVNEVTALCVALSCDIDELLRDHPAALERLYGRSGEARSADYAVAAAAARRSELLADLVNRLATALNVAYADVERIAQDLYGHDVLVERDARLAGTPADDPRDRARRLGHVTREIRRDLATYLSEQDCGPDEPEPPF